MLFSLYIIRGLLKKPKKVIEEVAKTCYTNDELLEIARNAMGYGWEIAKGAPLAQEITASPNNPFLNDTWQEALDG